MKIRPFLFITIFLLVFLSTGCPIPSADNPELPADSDISIFLPDSDLDGDGILNGADTDIDGDGVDNITETSWGLSPYLEDTDGDGFKDMHEISNFVESTNVFNPIIADLPNLSIKLNSRPIINMQFTTSSGHEINYTTTDENSESFTSSDSNTYSQTSSSEYNIETKIGVEGTFGVGKAEVSVSNEVSFGATYGSSACYEWGTEKSKENSHISSLTKGLISSEETNNVGGRISYAVILENNGAIAYDIESIALSSYSVDYREPTLITDIINLNADNFTATLGPEGSGNSSTGEISFYNNELTVGQTTKLLSSSNGLICGLSGYTLSMEGNTFTTSSTDIAARTAKIIIDYGPGINQPLEQYFVATKTHFNPDATDLSDLFIPLKLSEIMTTALNITYEDSVSSLSGFSGLTSIRSIAEDTNKLWSVVHYYTEDNKTWMSVYSANRESYDFSNIQIKTGDIVELIYSVDLDNDGLSARIEQTLGTDDEDDDSDEDGWNDYVEIMTHRTNPANADTDGDGINDNIDPDPLLPAVSPDVTLTSIVLGGTEYGPVDEAYSADSIAVNVVGETTSLMVIPADKNAVMTCHLYDSADEEIIYQTLPATPAIYGIISGEEIDINNLALGVNRLKIHITSSDSSTSKEYNIVINSSLQPLPGFNVSDIQDQPESLLVSWENVIDSRVGAIAIVRSLAPGNEPAIPANSTLLTAGSEYSGSVSVYYKSGPDITANSFIDNSAARDIGNTLEADSTYIYKAYSIELAESGETKSLQASLSKSARTWTWPKAHFNVWFTYYVPNAVSPEESYSDQADLSSYSTMDYRRTGANTVYLMAVGGYVNNHTVYENPSTWQRDVYSGGQFPFLEPDYSGNTYIAEFTVDIRPDAEIRWWNLTEEHDTAGYRLMINKTYTIKYDPDNKGDRRWKATITNGTSFDLTNGVASWINMDSGVIPYAGEVRVGACITQTYIAPIHN